MNQMMTSKHEDSFKGYQQIHEKDGKITFTHFQLEVISIDSYLVGCDDSSIDDCYLSRYSLSARIQGSSYWSYPAHPSLQLWIFHANSSPLSGRYDGQHPTPRIIWIKASLRYESYSYQNIFLETSSFHCILSRIHTVNQKSNWPHHGNLTFIRFSVSIEKDHLIDY